MVSFNPFSLFNGSEPSSSSSTPPADSSSTPRHKLRMYKERAFYRPQNILDVVRESPLCHVAFQCGDTLMNLPLIIAVRPPVDEQEEDDEEEEREEYVWLHSHPRSSLVEAIQKDQVKILTASCAIVDSLVFSPTPQDHSFNYRSANLHLHSPVLLSNEIPCEAKEKSEALQWVVDQSMRYPRSQSVGIPSVNSKALRGTAVIRCSIRCSSGKQRMGGWKGGRSAQIDEEEADETKPMQGALPCWIQYGQPIGSGKDVLEVKEIYDEISQRNREAAIASALVDGRYKLAGRK